ncbi:MAG: glycine cleavage system aminomethyltransferase GcvT, partial [Candidatus Marinimicrobia bacterium]|nr:glycine cleavage system aminomethyltransferase GcvT [Candidatus Neomarinimicrobiota bacterium]
DTLRLEMKYCLYGNDIDETTNPLEAGIGWITKLKIEDDFIGKQALLDLKKEGLKRKLISFKMLGRGIPRHAYNVKISGGTIGVVTSGTQSPTLSAAIGLAYVDKKYSKIGEKINIEIRGKEIEAEIVKAPFVNSSPM